MMKRDLGDHEGPIAMPSLLDVVFLSTSYDALGLINRTNIHAVTYLTVEGKRNDNNRGTIDETK